ncbi:MAG: polyphenol oxidase family protein [Coriobacteriaceae bacterium]|jgi:YfiH family protein|nr:polyphenol oxidase family protein [Coriobacteriaceae bacterium]
MTSELPLPRFSRGSFASVTAHTDEALFAQLGVRIAFTQRHGGKSVAPYGSLNLGSAVGDLPAAVEANRDIVLEAFGSHGLACMVPKQVHGDTVLTVAMPEEPPQAEEEADALAIEVDNVAALLCFADCVPLIAVSPTGRFAVIHAGWRGVESGIAGKAIRHLAALDQKAGAPGDPSHYNVYIGAHIHSCCFEADPGLVERFNRAFAPVAVTDGNHIDLNAAVRSTLAQAGITPQRIADVACCTACSPQEYFSHRASGGTCGRQGAFAIRLAGTSR